MTGRTERRSPVFKCGQEDIADTEEAVYKSYEVVKNKFTGATENTTIGAVITNAAFPKSSLCKIAGMAHDGYARAIRPVHTSSDGDSIYALSVGDVKADQDMVGTSVQLWRRRS